MRTFSGRLWLVEDRDSEVDARVLLDLDEETLGITSNETKIGEWPFDEIELVREGKEVHLTVEGEELVIVSGDVWFAPALEQAFAPSNRRRHLIEQDPQNDDGGVTESDGEDEERRSLFRSRRRGAHRRPGAFKFKW